LKTRATTTSCFTILVVALAIVVSLFWNTAPSRPFFYDEADYMYAGTRGLLDNYLDRPSLSLVEFVRKGLELAHDKNHRSDMSRYVRSTGDITFYRHYHGPVYALWIALVHAAGVHNEATYRASGLILHTITTLLIFWCFRSLFPEYSVFAAGAAALTFLMNRTALVSSTTVTQHVMFTLVGAVTLFLIAQFFRTGERVWWYAGAATLGIAFATVESSFILVATIILLLAMRAPQIGWKAAWQLFLRGIAAFIAAVLIVWPKGVLQLGALKGYLYLAYMALSRKTFTPIGPVQLWFFKLTAYPEEFVIPIAALLASIIFWKKLANRQAILPFVVYSWMFIVATIFITLPYTYYHASLLMSLAVVVGAMFGELWRRPILARVSASLVLLASLVFMTVRYYGETTEVRSDQDPRRNLLAYLGTHQTKNTYVPFILVPTLHFYRPEQNTSGYDPAASPTDLANSLLASGTNSELLCEQGLCAAVGKQIRTSQPVLVMGPDQDLGQGPLYSLVVENGGALSR
jgi:hypothetical protein